MAVAVLFLGLVLNAGIVELEIPQASCPDSPTHRRLCLQTPDWVMQCPRWSALVRTTQVLGAERFRALLLEYLKTKSRLERDYMLAYARDAAEFVESHQFEHPDHAFAAAMVACGAYGSS